MGTNDSAHVTQAASCASLEDSSGLCSSQGDRYASSHAYSGYQGIIRVIRVIRVIRIISVIRVIVVIRVIRVIKVSETGNCCSSQEHLLRQFSTGAKAVLPGEVMGRGSA